MNNEDMLGDEYWAIQARILEQSTPPNPDNLSPTECHKWNSVRIRLLLDEVAKAKSAGKHVLAADLSCLMADLVVGYRDMMILTIPGYNLMRTTAERMSASFGAEKPKFPEDN